MKNKLYIYLVALLFVASSCETAEWPQSDLSLVPVYTLSSLVGTPSVYRFEIYKTKSLLIQSTTTSQFKTFTTSSYLDASNETSYSVSFKASQATKTVLGADTTLNSRYELSADKGTKVGTLKVVSYVKQDSVISNYTMKISEDEVYN